MQCIEWNDYRCLVGVLGHADATSGTIGGASLLGGQSPRRKDCANGRDGATARNTIEQNSVHGREQLIQSQHHDACGRNGVAGALFRAQDCAIYRNVHGVLGNTLGGDAR